MEREDDGFYRHEGREKYTVDLITFVLYSVEITEALVNSVILLSKLISCIFFCISIFISQV